MYEPDGTTIVPPTQLDTVKDCCQACQGMAACGAYVYSSLERMCYFKVRAWSNKQKAEGMGSLKSKQTCLELV